jgi:hypothetical protein
MNAGIERAAALMSGFHGPWGIAGGWAIDLFLGRETRPHADIDVAILRDDQRALHTRLAGARVEKVATRQLVHWSVDETLAPPVHEVHATWPDGYHLEFLLNERDRQTGEWIYRRDPRIRLPIEAAFCDDRAVGYLAPEIVLLYKSKAPIAKDDADFESVRPFLRAKQRAWFEDALSMTAPGHRWGSANTRASPRAPE